MKMDHGYKYRAIGAGMILLSVISVLVGEKFNISFFYMLFLPLILLGLSFAHFGFTKIEIPNNKSYEEYLRKTNKIDLILFPITLLILAGSSMIAVVFQNIWLAVILLIIGTVLAFWFKITFYTTSAKAIDHVIKSNEKTRRKAILWIIGILVVSIIVWSLVDIFILN